MTAAYKTFSSSLVALCISGKWSWLGANTDPVARPFSMEPRAFTCFLSFFLYLATPSVWPLFLFTRVRRQITSSYDDLAEVRTDTTTPGHCFHPGIGASASYLSQ